MAAPDVWKFDGTVSYGTNESPLLITADQRTDHFWVTIDGPGKVFLEFSFEGAFIPLKLETICKRKLRLRLGLLRGIKLNGDWQRNSSA